MSRALVVAMKVHAVVIESVSIRAIAKAFFLLFDCIFSLSPILLLSSIVTNGTELTHTTKICTVVCRNDSRMPDVCYISSRLVYKICVKPASDILICCENTQKTAITKQSPLIADY